MSRKLNFKPLIKRVKLNPEQAVLTCTCYAYGMRVGSYGNGWTADNQTNRSCGGGMWNPKQLYNTYLFNDPSCGGTSYVAAANTSVS